MDNASIRRRGSDRQRCGDTEPLERSLPKNHTIALQNKANLMKTTRLFIQFYAIQAHGLNKRASFWPVAKKADHAAFSETTTLGLRFKSALF